MEQAEQVLYTTTITLADNADGTLSFGIGTNPKVLQLEGESEGEALARVAVAERSNSVMLGILTAKFIGDQMENPDEEQDSA